MITAKSLPKAFFLAGMMAVMIWGGACRRPLATIDLVPVDRIPWNENLLLADGVVLTASSHNLESERVENLLDESPHRFWHVDVKMLGLPAWVEADFGEGNAVVASSLAARPRVDQPDRLFGDQFLRNAQVQASHDGVNWTTLAWIRQARQPDRAQWYRCDFRNDEAYRFYRLLVLDGHTGERNYFLSLSGLALFD